MKRIYYNEFSAILVDEKAKTYRYVSSSEGLEHAKQIGVQAIYRTALNQREEFLIDLGFKCVF
ncbi:hypothetical protein [Enterococcus sp. AZ015]|uniref:hypothetical protein n=1 Tax=unclassified Enterococcus TaxID=2608891 RepID=UPI003D2B3DE3